MRSGRACLVLWTHPALHQLCRRHLLFYLQAVVGNPMGLWQEGVCDQRVPPRLLTFLMFHPQLRSTTEPTTLYLSLPPLSILHLLFNVSSLLLISVIDMCPFSLIAFSHVPYTFDHYLQSLFSSYVPSLDAWRWGHSDQESNSIPCSSGIAVD